MGTGLIAAGIIGALLAVIAGLTDYLTVPMPQDVKRTSTTHMLLNLGIVVLYTINLLLRMRTPEIVAGCAPCSNMSIGGRKGALPPTQDGSNVSSYGTGLAK